MYLILDSSQTESIGIVQKHTLHRKALSEAIQL